jgi:hypothetical protein
MATTYKVGDEVEVETRSTGMILLGRYTLLERQARRGTAWEAKHLATGRVMTLYEDEFVRSSTKV